LELLAAGALHIAPDVVAQSAHIGSTPCAAAKETENVKPAGNDELLALELGLLAASNSLPATRRMVSDILSASRPKLIAISVGRLIVVADGPKRDKDRTGYHSDAASQMAA